MHVEQRERQSQVGKDNRYKRIFLLEDMRQ